MHNEAELIYHASQGRRSAIAALYRQHVDAIHRYVSYRVADAAAADDLTAEVFLRMVEGLPCYRQNGTPFEAWLYRIAAARVADYYRLHNRHPHEELSEHEPDHGDLPEHVLQDTEESDTLRAALSQLSDDYQQVLLLRFVERKSHAEVAGMMGKTVTAIKSAQHRALTQLAALMGQNGKARSYLRGNDDE